MKKLVACLFTCAVILTGAVSLEASDDVIKIGVLAKRGPEKCLKKWMPTAEYLSEKLGKTVRIQPLKFDAVPLFLKNKKIDFFLVNSSMFCDMKNQFGGRAIATLKNARQGNALTKFGGVIFVKADSPIKTIQDIKGKTFMCVKKSSFGGYQMALREMKMNGVDPENDCPVFKEAGTHDKVVEMVLKGVIQVGTVRSDTIERMVAEGKLKMSDIRVIHQQKDDFPFVHSTQLYPEWPMASCADTDPELANAVADALINMPPDSPAAKAGKCLGWIKPLSYTQVENLLSTLNLGSFASAE